jgi:hypothetical protein
MSVLDRLRAASMAFLAPPSESGGRSLSAQRAMDRFAWTYLGTMGKRIANDDQILTTHGGGDLALWKDILDDDKVYSCFQQRRLAVVSRPWEVEAGGKDRKSKKAAEFLRAQINRVGWDRICDRMLYGVWYGYGVAEGVYRVEPDGDWAGLIGLDRIDVPDRGWFGFDAAGGLRITDAMGVRDEAVPDRKFWHFASGGDNDFVHYGVGLAHWCFWPVFFKRQGYPFWLRFLERFGSPTVKGKVAQGYLDTEDGRAKALSILRSISNDAAVAYPDWMEVDILDAARAGPGGFELLIDRCDDSIQRVILSQTMTSEAGPAGLGSGQANVHKDVRDEVVRSDADLIHESFNRTIATWLTEFNFPGAAPPRVYRQMEDPEDLDTLATRDEVLKGLGWERTEDSFHEVYGEGYEKAEPVAPPPGMVPNATPPNPSFAATDPQPLYVSRKLLNVGEFVRWAKGQGFANVADDLHVTVLYSREPVNWFKMGTDFRDKVTVMEGGPRKVDKLGDQGAVVLHFASSDLEWRHEEMIHRGASHDYPEFQCHVTITYDGGDLDLSKVEPYTGKLVFGPEIFERIDSEWTPPSTDFAAADLDAIDRLVTAMGDAGNEAVFQFIAPLKDKLAGISNPELLRIALLNHLETMDRDQFAAVLADPMLALRAAAEVGLSEKVEA